MINLKYDLLKKPLELYKSHDFCADKNPELTVIFIHGIAADWTSFKNAIDYLEGTRSLQKVRFIAFDLLGAGNSYSSDKLNYDFNDQLSALDNSIKKLNLTTPVVLIGHSMGTLIATRYAENHKRLVKKLILVSPPVYREEDLKNPAFKAAMEAFREVMSRKNRKILETKAFNNEIELIVSNPKNYEKLVQLTTPAVLIYGELDQIIAPFNIPGLLKKNPNITAVRTPGKHSVSHDKYVKILGVLEETIHD